MNNQTTRAGELQGVSLLSYQGITDQCQYYGHQDTDSQYTIGVATGVPVTFISTGTNATDGVGGLLDFAQFLVEQPAPPTVVTTGLFLDEQDVSRSLAMYVLPLPHKTICAQPGLARSASHTSSWGLVGCRCYSQVVLAASPEPSSTPSAATFYLPSPPTAHCKWSASNSILFFLLPTAITA